MDVPVAANVLGTVGAVCWSIQLIPQIVINYRRHSTTGLQPTMMLLWAWAGVPLGVYNIVENFNLALQIQPQILTSLSFITWAQCMYYSFHWPWPKILGAAIPLAVFMGAVEVGLIFALKEAEANKIKWPSTFMAVLAAVLLCAGVGRHYWDIWKTRTVRGISFLFVGIDAMGDVTSLISIFFQPELDILGMVVYGSELALWLGVFACGGCYNFRPWLAVKLRDGGTREGASSCAEDCGRGDEGTSTALEDVPSRRSSSVSSRTVFQTASVSGGNHDDTAGQRRYASAA